MRGIDVEERARRALRRRHAGYLSLIGAHACGGLAEACAELRSVGAELEAESAEALHLEVTTALESRLTTV